MLLLYVDHLAQVRGHALPVIERQGPIRAWIVDDTGFPKKGRHAVGVARQSRGQLGKQDNCQVAVSLWGANEAASLPVADRLSLPQAWADGPEQRRKAGTEVEHPRLISPELLWWTDIPIGCRGLGFGWFADC